MATTADINQLAGGVIPSNKKNPIINSCSNTNAELSVVAQTLQNLVSTTTFRTVSDLNNVNAQITTLKNIIANNQATNCGCSTSATPTNSATVIASRNNTKTPTNSATLIASGHNAKTPTNGAAAIEAGEL